MKTSKVVVLLDHKTGKTAGVPIEVEPTEHPANKHYGKVVKVTLRPGAKYPDFYPENEVSRNLAESSITEPDHFYEKSIMEVGAPDAINDKGPTFKVPEHLNVAQVTEHDTGNVRYYFVYMLDDVEPPAKRPIGFVLTEPQSEKFRTWRDDAIHEECRKQRAEVGGAITFHITPTRAGLVIKADCCICKNEIDLSENW